MFRFRMSRDDECEWCGEVETYKHLFWECRESRRVWRSYNEYVEELNQRQSVVNSYEGMKRLLLVKCYDNKKVSHPTTGSFLF